MILAECLFNYSYDSEINVMTSLCPDKGIRVSFSIKYIEESGKG